MTGQPGSPGFLRVRRRLRRAPLATLLLTLGLPSAHWGQAEAKVRLGDPLPAHPWTAAPRELVVVYGSGCGDMDGLWDAVRQSGLPLRAVFAEGDFGATRPPPVQPWQGADATAFARSLRVAQYPTILLVEDGRLMNVWEGEFGWNSPAPAPSAR